MVGVKFNDEPAFTIPNETIPDFFGTIAWGNTALLCHNINFDGLILSHHYKCRPSYYLDTLSMARALHSNKIGASLDQVSQFYGVGNKIPDILNLTKGVENLHDHPNMYPQLAEYCAMDVNLCYEIFQKMLPKFPKVELDLINLTARMFIEPVLKVDIDLAQTVLDEEITNKAQLVEKSGVSKETLSSNNKFAQALIDKGVTPPVKISKRTGEEAWAFSKADEGLQDLMNHEDPAVQNLVEARLAVKSTINETRATRFIQAGQEGSLPVHLNYFGAHTGRWSAGNKMNLQNLPRGGKLRRSILAPDGYVVLVADSAQIEARVLAWLAEDTEYLDLFARGEDVYKHMASQIYRCNVDEVNKSQRFVGKTAVLGLGYQMGAQRFLDTVNNGDLPEPIGLGEAKDIVNVYRTSRHKIKTLWSTMEKALADLLFGDRGGAIRDGCIAWGNDSNPGLGPFIDYKVDLPNGLYLHYPQLSADFAYAETREYEGLHYFSNNGKDKNHIYGGLATENIVQALARIIISVQMLAIDRKLTSIDSTSRVVSMAHDEIIGICPKSEADDCLAFMLNIMKSPLPWCLDLPLDCEGGYDINYSK